MSVASIPFMKSKVISLDQAATLIPDEATVSVSGAWMLLPDALLAAIERRFLAEQHPKNLTATFLLCPGGTADQPGVEHLAHEGLLRRTIGGSYPNLAQSRLRRLIAEDRVAAYNFPAGMIASWYREIAANRAGALSTAGLGTFVDPRVEGGRMNAAAAEDIMRVVSLGGREYLHLPARRIDVALIRATSADEAGNLSFEHEPATLTAYVQAAAARASGGVVIAQVKRVVARGKLPAHAVRVPGSLVDHLVVEPEPMQASGVRFDPALAGEERTTLRAASIPVELDRLLARRAQQEIRAGDVVVLGFGVSALVPHLMLAENRFEAATFTVEQGSHGGLPLTEFGFGSSYNPMAILDSASQFDFFHGGCFDVALLSFLQVDADGRVNVHRLDARPALSAGIGGFLDIAANARRLVLLSTFTAGGLQVAMEGGRLRIVQEGRMRKFVSRLDHVSFDPQRSRATEILYVTERAVLRWRAGRLAVVEVAPGIDLERDVLAQMDFTPAVELGQPFTPVPVTP